jgi:uridine kinase
LVALPSTLSFEKGLFVLVRAIQLLTSAQPGKVVVVGLGGPSGAGKSQLACRLHELTPVTVIPLDNFLSISAADAHSAEVNFDDPRNTDFDAVLSVLASLKEHRQAAMPVWDYKTSSRSGSTTPVTVGPNGVVVVEGIYALHPRLRHLLDVSVSISGGVHRDLIKRIQRDVARCAQSPVEIIQQVSETVFPMYKLYVEPDLESAAIRVSNTFNPFSAFQKSATYSLKSAEPGRVSVEAATAYLAACGDVAVTEEQERTSDLYLMPPGEDGETCRDWIRMRQREGKYSLSFEEIVADGNVLISPHLSFDVPVRTLSGLMALGYSLGAIIKRDTLVLRRRPAGSEGAANAALTIKYDTITQLGSRYIQVEGQDRAAVEAAGAVLGLDGTYVPRSFIELVQLGRLLTECPPRLDDFLPQHAQGGIITQLGDGDTQGETSMASPGGTSLHNRAPWTHVEPSGTAAAAAAAAVEKGGAQQAPGARRLLRLDDAAETASPAMRAAASQRGNLAAAAAAGDAQCATCAQLVPNLAALEAKMAALEQCLRGSESAGLSRHDASSATNAAAAGVAGIALGCALVTLWGRCRR